MQEEASASEFDDEEEKGSSSSSSGSSGVGNGSNRNFSFPRASSIGCIASPDGVLEVSLLKHSYLCSLMLFKSTSPTLSHALNILPRPNIMILDDYMRVLIESFANSSPSLLLFFSSILLLFYSSSILLFFSPLLLFLFSSLLLFFSSSFLLFLLILTFDIDMRHCYVNIATADSLSLSIYIYIYI